ncbi:MAG: M20 family metallopeptidase [Alphaproteobacteria bacterium]|nr:M20 family metallopeptidase [Alphaproteobacteria bacterium]
MSALAKLKSQNETFTKWRRHIHQHPEIAFEEDATSDYVANLLKEWGVDNIDRGMAKTAVVATIKGKKPGNENRAIGIRADMDALPMPEETNLPYASKHAGKMHACGHDGHTAMLLAAVKHLAETRDFAGTVHAIFQPAEEGAGGGNVMVQEGFFDKFPCEAVFAMHNWPWLEAGHMAICEGAMSAASDAYEIGITGKGGHAAFPHNTHDVVVCGAQIVSALQHLVSRTTDPLHSAVVSVCNFHAGSGAKNVLPETATLSGTVRTLDPADRDRIEKKMHDVTKSIAAAFDCSVEVNYKRGYPSTVNTPKETEFARSVAVDVVGADKVHEFVPMMGGEDFSYFLEACPGAYIILGGAKTDSDPGLHNTHYDFNDDVLPVGAAYWVRMVEKWLG